MSFESGSRASFLRSRLAIEEDDCRVVFQHFARDPAGAIFGSIWLSGWMFGLVLIARDSPWPWRAREVLLLAALFGIWLTPSGSPSISSGQ